MDMNLMVREFGWSSLMVDVVGDMVVVVVEGVVVDLEVGVGVGEEALEEVLPHAVQSIVFWCLDCPPQVVGRT